MVIPKGRGTQPRSFFLRECVYVSMANNSNYSILSGSAGKGETSLSIDIPYPVENNNFIVWLILPTGKVVQGSGSYNNGSISITNKIDTSDEWGAIVYRAETAVLNATLKSSGEVSLSDIIAQFSKNVRVLEQLETLVKTSVRAVDEIGPLPNVAKRAGKFISFDANGNPVADTPVDTLESNRRGAEDAQKNAKYYAQQAEIAKDFAYEAQDKAEQAEADAQKWAIGPNSTTETPDDTNNAKYYANQADISRQEADEALTYISGKVDEFDKTVESAVTSAKSEIDVYTLASKDAIDEAFYDAEKDFNSLVLTKTTTFNNNYSNKYTSINTIARQVSSTADNVDKCVSGFDTNVSTATTTFNNNATTKTNTFNENYEEKLESFNDNATTATTTFNRNARTKHSEIYTLYSNAKRNLDGYVDEAEYALKNAVEIADPEGWRRNTRSMINVLQQTKSNKGEFYFNGGNAKIQNMAMNGSWSLCCRVRMQSIQVQYSTIFQLGSFYLYWNTRLGVVCSPIIQNVQQISTNDNDRLVDGQWHSLVASYDGTTLKLSDETGVLLSVTTSEPISISDNSLIIGGTFNGQLADVKYFNFDMSANDAPYTIADYMAGKEESPLLQTTQPIIDWHNLNGSTRVGSTFTLSTASASYPRLFQNGTFKPNREYSIDISGNVLYVNGQQNVGVRIDLPTSKAILTNKITGEVSEITNSTITLWLGNGTDFDVNVRFVANAENTDNNCFFRLNQSGRADSYFTLSAQSVGALLSLEDYSFNGKIADVSGNNNDATITGDVVGTKDKSIEKMYQAFASKIGNVTE